MKRLIALLVLIPAICFAGSIYNPDDSTLGGVPASYYFRLDQDNVAAGSNTFATIEVTNFYLNGVLITNIVTAESDPIWSAAETNVPRLNALNVFYSSQTIRRAADAAVAISVVNTNSHAAAFAALHLGNVNGVAQGRVQLYNSASAAGYENNLGMMNFYTDLGATNTFDVLLGAVDGGIRFEPNSTAAWRIGGNGNVDGYTNTWSNFVIGASTLIGAHVLPNASNVYDVGSLAFPIRHLYTGTGSVYIGGVPITSDGSSKIVIADLIDDNTNTYLTAANAPVLNEYNLFTSNNSFVGWMTISNSGNYVSVLQDLGGGYSGLEINTAGTGDKGIELNDGTYNVAIAASTGPGNAFYATPLANSDEVAIFGAAAVHIDTSSTSNDAFYATNGLTEVYLASSGYAIRTVGDSLFAGRTNYFTGVIDISGTNSGLKALAVDGSIIALSHPDYSNIVDFSTTNGKSLLFGLAIDTYSLWLTGSSSDEIYVGDTVYDAAIYAGPGTLTYAGLFGGDVRVDGDIESYQATTNSLTIEWWAVSNRWAAVQRINNTTNVTFLSP